MIKVKIIIAPGFIATEVAAVIDVFRIANRLAVRPVSELRIACSTMDTHLDSLGGLVVVAEPLHANDPLPDILIVAGGAGLSRPAAALPVRSQKVIRAGGRIILLSDATIALMRGYAPGPTVVHWESEAILSEQAEDGMTATRLFAQAGGLITCAGMAATYDAMLAIVSECASGLLADDVARVLLLDRRRPGNTDQLRGRSDSPGLPDGPLRRALQLMESSIETPASTADICRAIGISSRQLERIFARSLGISPKRYHRGLRLRRAKLLVESSHLPLLQISLACGFETSSNFSREFRKEFGVSPLILRKRMTDWKAAPSAKAHEAPTAPGMPRIAPPPDLVFGAHSIVKAEHPA